MRKLILTVFCVCFWASTQAQVIKPQASARLGDSPLTAKEEIRKNVTLSASNYLAYPLPHKKLTPAPKGLKPFYISHYGRHGSRYLNSMGEYNYPYEVLLAAREQGKLTPLGIDVVRRLELMCEEALGHLGELTPLGAEQHRQIARRMYERFPEVFAGEAVVSARSTTVVRCILSMENALQELLSLNPHLRISHDASQSDMYYMNQQDRKLTRQKNHQGTMDLYEDYQKKHDSSARLGTLLFNDTTYVSSYVNLPRFNFYLFRLASSIQNCEVRRRITLYDLYNDEEIYQNWLKENTWWYLAYGNNPLNGGTQPFSQRNLLRRLIHDTDSCLQLEKPGATLRFGHETVILPLVCLLGLNGYDQQITNIEKIDRKGWVNYRVFPMAANLQFVFYRKGAQDKDVLFKVLLNEEEASLPLKTKTAPYYSWSDFRDYYLQKLDTYKE